MDWTITGILGAHAISIASVLAVATLIAHGAQRAAAALKAYAEQRRAEAAQTATRVDDADAEWLYKRALWIAHASDILALVVGFLGAVLPRLAFGNAIAQAGNAPSADHARPGSVPPPSQGGTP
jgi:F0F1-type ATP synthase assembly protein I